MPAVPVQIALVLPPTIVVTGWIWALTSGRSVRARAGALVGWLLVVVVTFTTASGLPRAAERTPTTVAYARSSELWSSSLQSPEHRLIRRQVVPSGAGPQQLKVRYEWDARAQPLGTPLPEIAVSVGGMDLPPALAGANPEEPWCCNLVWPVPAAAIAQGGLTEIRVWQPRRDARVRFIAQRNPYAARLGPEGSQFHDGVSVVFGVPHTDSGSLRPGFLHVWLEPLD